jgi:hypothetical protein
MQYPTPNCCVTAQFSFVQQQPTLLRLVRPSPARLLPPLHIQPSSLTSSKPKIHSSSIHSGPIYFISMEPPTLYVGDTTPMTNPPRSGLFGAIDTIFIALTTLAATITTIQATSHEHIVVAVGAPVGTVTGIIGACPHHSTSLPLSDAIVSGPTGTVTGVTAVRLHPLAGPPLSTTVASAIAGAPPPPLAPPWVPPVPWPRATIVSASAASTTGQDMGSAPWLFMG